MKTRWLLILCMAVLGWRGSPATAQSREIEDIEVRVNGEPVHFVGTGPQEYRGRVLVPLRGVLEKLGAYVGWDAPARTVIATRGDMSIRLPIGSDYAEVNGRRVPLEIAAMTVNGSTMVPLRFIGETLGAVVRWDSAQHAVVIETDSTTEPRSHRPDFGDFRRPGREHRVEPAPAPVSPPTPLAATSMSHNLRDAWVRPGQSVTVTMRGTRGAQGRFRIPGIAQDVPMREVEPGVYEGNWTAPADRAIQVGDAAIVGLLRSGDRESPLIQASDPIRVDTTPPLIEEPLPATGSVVARRRPPISASFSDRNGSGVARDKVTLLLDRTDVTRGSVVTDRFITYTPPAALIPGDHSVELLVSDEAGNMAAKKWTFNVSPRPPGIRSVQANADRVLEPGDVLNVRVEGAPGSRAQFSVGGIRNIPLTEQSPGIYAASYTIRKGDDVASAPLSVTLLTPEGERFTDTGQQKVRVSTGPPAQPVILYPGRNDRLTNPLVVRGTAPPYSIVRLKVEYVNRLLGVLAVRGAADEQDIKVAADGRWSSRPIDISSLLGSRNTEYTLTAITISATDERSQVTTLRFGGR